MSKNTLQSLSAVGKAAAADSRANAAAKLQAPLAGPIASPSATELDKAKETAERERLNCYLTGVDVEKLRKLRRLVVNATGDGASGNALIQIALRSLDLDDKDKILGLYTVISREDGRRAKKN